MFLLLALLGCDDYAALAEDAPAARDCKTRTAYYKDADGDGVGVDTDVVITCDAAAGYVTTAGDCDDTDAKLTTDCPVDTGDTATDSGTDTAADTADSGDTATDSGDSAA